MSINIKGLNDSITRLELFEKSIPQREQKCLKLLADIGIDVANVRFSQAQYDGENDVAVTGPKWIDSNTIALYAVGKSVAFIEFGTGIVYSEQHPLADELGLQRGSYGKGKGNQNTWGYYGEQGSNGKYIKSSDKGNLFLTHGNPPNRAMYEAGEAVRKQILSIVKQVFSFD